MDAIEFKITVIGDSCKVESTDRRVMVSDRNTVFKGTAAECTAKLSEKYNARGYEVLFAIFED